VYGPMLLKIMQRNGLSGGSFPKRRPRRSPASRLEVPKAHKLRGSVFWHNEICDFRIIWPNELRTPHAGRSSLRQPRLSGPQSSTNWMGAGRRQRP
jgi:hypothetical protein